MKRSRLDFKIHAPLFPRYNNIEKHEQTSWGLKGVETRLTTAHCLSGETSFPEGGAVPAGLILTFELQNLKISEHDKSPCKRPSHTNKQQS